MPWINFLKENRIYRKIHFLSQKLVVVLVIIFPKENRIDLKNLPMDRSRITKKKYQNIIVSS